MQSEQEREATTRREYLIDLQKQRERSKVLAETHKNRVRLLDGRIAVFNQAHYDEWLTERKKESKGDASAHEKKNDGSQRTINHGHGYPGDRSNVKRPGSHVGPSESESVLLREGITSRAQYLQWIKVNHPDKVTSGSKPLPLVLAVLREGQRKFPSGADAKAWPSPTIV
jgi:hypothetical protein